MGNDNANGSRLYLGHGTRITEPVEGRQQLISTGEYLIIADSKRQAQEKFRSGLGRDYPIYRANRWMLAVKELKAGRDNVQLEERIEILREASKAKVLR